jgi:integrase
MSQYKRGDVWWYKFQFNGQAIRESAHTNSKTVARDAERARRRELELAVNRIPKRRRMPLFSAAAAEWLETKTKLSSKSVTRYKQCIENLKAEFSGRLVCDVDSQDIAAYQRKRLAAEVSNRTVNYEVGTLRGILKLFGVWGQIADEVDALKENHDVGRALSRDEEEALIKAAGKSRSPALLPLLVFSLDTGMRASEVRSLRRCDLVLIWKEGVITSGEAVVPKSKTEAGTGRSIPLTQRVCATLTIWLSRFPGADEDAYVFPRHSVGIAGNSRVNRVWNVDLTRPIGEWKSAWSAACKDAKVRYRWHDLRHTFVSRLAENPAVSEGTIKALAGHVSKRMLERYSHIRTHAKRAAIESLEQVQVPIPAANVLKPTEAQVGVFDDGGHKIGHNQ